jgi:hypothetical protein
MCKTSSEHPLVDFHSPSEYAHKSSRRGRLLPKQLRSSAPPMRFLPLQRLPAQDSGLSSREYHTRLPTPSGFLNLLTLQPSRACRPCFMPNPLMGFALQSVAPLTQPYAVSSASCPHAVGETTKGSTDTKHDSRKHLGSAPVMKRNRERAKSPISRLQGLAPCESPPPALTV